MFTKNVNFVQNKCGIWHKIRHNILDYTVSNINCQKCKQWCLNVHCAKVGYSVNSITNIYILWKFNGNIDEKILRTIEIISEEVSDINVGLSNLHKPENVSKSTVQHGAI